MNVPFVDLKAQYQAIKREILPALNAVLDSSQYILGEAVADFERRFAAAHATKHCIGVSSGTDALHIVLWALGIGPGDEVITVPHTFIATAEAISLTGARPVFVDIDPLTYTMDPALLGAAVTPRTKAILPVHLYGQAAPMDVIAATAAKNGVPVIEDACQAHLAQYNGRFVGQFGAAAAFSFYPGKNIGAFGEAGAVTTDDDNLAQTIRMLRDHGQAQKYHHRICGHNYRMDGIQGAVLGVKLNHLASWTDARRKHAAAYSAMLSGVGDIITPVESPGAKHVYHLYVILTERRDALQAHLSARGVGSGLHYPVPLHLQEAYRDLGYKAGDFPVTERVATRGLSLPMYPEMTEEQQAYVIASIKEFYS